MDATVDNPPPVRTRSRASREPRETEWADPIGEALLVIVVVGSVLAIGTVHVQSLLVVSALALIGGTLSGMALARLPAPAIVLGSLGLFSALQAAPLPARWVQWVSPASAEVWHRCLAPFGAALSRFPVSLDPGASIAEALKWLTYAAVYVMAVRVRARRGSLGSRRCSSALPRW